MSLLDSIRNIFRRNTAAANAAAAQRSTPFGAALLLPPTNFGAATYPLSKLAEADEAYLTRMDVSYRQATRGRQIWFDILTDDAGKMWLDLGGDGTSVGKALQARIVAIINAADRLPNVYQYDPTQYKGPLVQVLGAAVAKYRK